MDQKLNITIGGNTVQLERSLANVNRAISNSKRAANALSKDLKFDPGNADLLAQKQSELAQALELTGEKAQMLQAELDNVDPDVDPEKFYKLQGQIQKTARDAIVLRRELDQVGRVIQNSANLASSFEFDAGDGVREFTNNIHGVEAALSQLGNISNLRSFDSANASAQELQQHMRRVTQATELLNRKAGLLRTQLASIDPRVDPQSFARIQTEIHRVQQQLQELDSSPIGVDVNIGGQNTENQLNGFSSRLRSSLQRAGTNASRSIVSVMSRVPEAISTVLLPIGRFIGNVIQRGLQIAASVGRASLSVFTRVGSGIVNFIKTPLLGLGNVVRSALSGLSSIISTTIGGPLRSLGSMVTAGAKSVASTLTRLVLSPFRALGAGIAASLRGVGSILKSMVIAPIRGLGNVLSTATKSVASILARNVTSPFRNMGAAIKQITIGALRTIGQNLVNGLNRTLAGVKESMNATMVASKSLESVLKFGNVDDATIKQLQQDMNEYAKTTSYGASELNKIIANMSASNVEARKAGELTKNIANAYALLGDGTRDISDIGRIFAQINSAEKLMAEDFNQLVDAGLGGALKQEITRAFPDILAQFDNFKDAMAGSAITADMVNQALTNIGSSEAAVKAATVPKTVGAALDALYETLGQKFQTTYNTIQQKVIDIVTNITDTIDNLDFSTLNNVILKVFDNVINAVSRLVQFLKQIDLSSVLVSVRTIAAPITDVFANLAGQILDIFTSINWSSVMDQLKGVALQFIDLLKPLANYVISFISSLNLQSLLSALSSARVLLLQIVQGLLKLSTSLNIGDLLTSVIRGVVMLAKTFVSFVTSDTFISWISRVVSAIRRLISSLNFSAIFNALVRVFGSVINAVESILNLLSRLNVSDVFVELLNVLSQVINRVSALINGDTLVSWFKTLLNLGFRLTRELKLDVVFEKLLTIFNTLLNGLSTLMSIIERLGLGDLFIKALDAFAKFANKVVEFVGSGTFAGWISTITDSMVKLFGTISNVDIIGTLISTINNLLVLTNNLITTLKNAGIDSVFNDLLKAFNTFTTSIAAFTATDKFTGWLVKVKDVFYTIFTSETVKTVIRSIEPMFDAFIVGVHNIAKAFKESGIDEFFASIVQGVASLIGQISSLTGSEQFTQLAANIAGIFSQLFENVNFESLLDSAVNFITKFTSAIKESGIASLFGVVLVSIQELMDAITKQLDDENNLNTISSMVEKLKNLLLEIDFDRVVSAFVSIGEAIGQIIGTINVEGLGSQIMEIIGLVDDLALGLAKMLDESGIGSAVGDMLSGVLTIIKDIVKMVSQPGVAAAAIIGGLIAKGYQLFQVFQLTGGGLLPLIGIIAGVVAAFHALTIIFDVLNKDGKVSDGIMEIVKAFTYLYNIVADFVKNFFEGFKKGFEGMISQETIDKLSGGLSKIGKALQGVLKFIKPAIDFIAELLGWLAGSAIGLAVNILAELVDKLGSFLNWLMDIGKAIKDFGEKVIDFFIDTFGGSSDASVGSVSYSAPATTAGYSSNYSTTNNTTINVQASPGMNEIALARAVKHQFALGTA